MNYTAKRKECQEEVIKMLGICSCCGQAIDINDRNCLIFFRKNFHRECLEKNAPLFIDEYIAKYRTEFLDWCKMWGANPNDPTDRLDFGDCDSDFPEYVAERVILW
jgi:hypothetical protein